MPVLPTTVGLTALRDAARQYFGSDAVEIANELREEVVRVEFPDDQLQECASPLKLRCA